MKNMTDDELLVLEELAIFDYFLCLRGLNDPVNKYRQQSNISFRQQIELEKRSRKPKHYSDFIAALVLNVYEQNDSNAAKTARDLGMSRTVVVKLICEATGKPFKKGNPSNYPVERNPQKIVQIIDSMNCLNLKAAFSTEKVIQNIERLRQLFIDANEAIINNQNK
ncbi:hypothetical protein AB4160_16070 [Shewanella sp. 10N.286.51.B8]|uniref:hypothetical protein n=1 Tax=Shewanella sp. 10N.286.51.B8 TaxID=3229708 RepID=UPI00354B85A5